MRKLHYYMNFTDIVAFKDVFITICKILDLQSLFCLNIVSKQVCAAVIQVLGYKNIEINLRTVSATFSSKCRYYSLLGRTIYTQIAFVGGSTSCHNVFWGELNMDPIGMAVLPIVSSGLYKNCYLYANQNNILHMLCCDARANCLIAISVLPNIDAVDAITDILELILMRGLCNKYNSAYYNNKLARTVRKHKQQILTFGVDYYTDCVFTNHIINYRRT